MKKFEVGKRYALKRAGKRTRHFQVMSRKETSMWLQEDGHNGDGKRRFIEKDGDEEICHPNGKTYMAPILGAGSLEG